MFRPLACIAANDVRPPYRTGTRALFRIRHQLMLLTHSDIAERSACTTLDALSPRAVLPTTQTNPRRKKRPLIELVAAEPQLALSGRGPAEAAKAASSPSSNRPERR